MTPPKLQSEQGQAWKSIAIILMNILGTIATSGMVINYNQIEDIASDVQRIKVSIAKIESSRFTNIDGMNLSRELSKLKSDVDHLSPEDFKKYVYSLDRRISQLESISKWRKDQRDRR